MIQAVFFDFNGVIIDDEPLHMRAYVDTLKAEGIELTREDYMASLGMDDVTFVRAAYERAGREAGDEDLRRVIECEANMHRALIEDELPLFPGAVNFVKALSHHHPLAVVSMAQRVQIEYALERAGLAGKFPVVVSAEDVDACKPDPACYLKALERLNQQRGEAHIIPLRPDECLVIEDSPPGIRSGRAAGMRTLGVTNTVPEHALREAGSDIVTHSLADWTVDAIHHVFDTSWGRR